ncbi:MAG: fumarylacetoacetate hydrolase [Burkholderiales bacterium PBB6]|nr:MAG: fumarylacetoacetate hydrolase [Burkholderiales bacterium PBB6]
MKLCTLRNGRRDGALAVVSHDLQWVMPAHSVAPTLQAALDDWQHVAPGLQALYEQIDQASPPAEARPFDPREAMAPLPRAYQWLDGSAFSNHGAWMQRAFNSPALDTSMPLMYQGGSDDFLGPHDDAVFVSEAHGIDIEGEIAVITDDVAMGTRDEAALGHVRLLALVNDWSLRALQPREMGLGFGMVHSKPSTAFAPVVVTPDELGAAWSAGRLQLPLHVSINAHTIGRPHAGCMSVGFGRLIEHAASTRRLRAGTVIGSGTVSDPAEGAGSATLAEVRAIEKVTLGEVRTPFLRLGDRVRMEVWSDSGASLFGALDQRVCIASPEPGLHQALTLRWRG